MEIQAGKKNAMREPGWTADFSSGQTLIETMVAAFVLVMGIAAAVGLAIYAYGTSANTIKQIIATGLAREGAEAVKNMRDTNWLKQAAINDNCYNYETGAGDAKCYSGWLTEVFAIDPASSGKFLVRFNPDGAVNPHFWSVAELPSGTDQFGLNFNNNLESSDFTGFYYHPAVPVGNGSSNYYRRVIIEKDSAAPFNTAVGPRLKVRSQVWWTDQKCPRAAAFESANSACRLEIETFLTNWKNY